MKTYTTIKAGDVYAVICVSGNTRNGFKHEAELTKNGYTIESAKCCYINRTWECYTYQSVIHKVIEKARFSSDRKEDEKIKKALKRQFDKKALPRSCWDRIK